MILARTRPELAKALRDLRSRGSLGLVPTMGFLHDGHLSLVDRAAASAHVVAVSIFVNPLQFGPNEDLERYPRSEARDLALLEERGTALVFAPDSEEMYPEGEPLVTVAPGPMEARLCGAFRPGHFRGVLTVVAKLFGLIRPDVAVFGRKDFQQTVLVDRMVTDLEMGVDIITVPVVREPDGLAMSSRNAFLGPEERAQAPRLHAVLEAARERFLHGERDPKRVVRDVEDEVRRADRLDLQYVAAVDPHTLDDVARLDSDTVVALAAYCGATRLIDNVRLGG